MRRILPALALLVLTACSAELRIDSGPPTTAPAPQVTVDPRADMLNPDVTQATIATTICVPGWTATVRPPTTYTGPIETAQIARYGYTDRDPTHYELDHVIPLSLGGAPRAEVNLWPEPDAI